MIHTPVRRYQLVLWTASDRNETSVASRQEFDTLVDAKAALELARADGRYRDGILYEWLRHSASWELREKL